MFFPNSTNPSDYGAKSRETVLANIGWFRREREKILIFLAAAFLVFVPVFIQAPLVRWQPLLSLLLTVGWFWLSYQLWLRQSSKLWGDLLFGFSWTWLTGSIYWGWFRWEPLIHLPIEAIGVPFVLFFLWRGFSMVGNLFYLGCLIGTAITDLYFYLTDVIPNWRQLTVVDPALATPILQDALTRVQTVWGISWAIVLVNLLLAISLFGLQQNKLHWWGFAGAVLSTILVDSLFYLAASFATS